MAQGLTIQEPRAPATELVQPALRLVWRHGGAQCRRVRSFVDQSRSQAPHLMPKPGGSSGLLLQSAGGDGRRGFASSLATDFIHFGKSQSRICEKPYGTSRQQRHLSSLAARLYRQVFPGTSLATPRYRGFERPIPGQEAPLRNALVPIATKICDSRILASGQRPNADFVAHLIATAAQFPQTRARRRAEPGPATEAYRALGHWPSAPGRAIRRSM